jgi:hypothetical protein
MHTINDQIGGFIAFSGRYPQQEYWTSKCYSVKQSIHRIDQLNQNKTTREKPSFSHS